MIAMADCTHCGLPLVPDALSELHSWCYRNKHWGEPMPDLVPCGPQCGHAPGARHGVYLYTAGTRTVMARVQGFYPRGSLEVEIRTSWDSDQ